MNPEIPTNGVTLILGGARSGKSTFAEKLGREAKKKVLFVATATAGDNEMAERIRNHQASRPVEWQTRELPRGLGQQLTESLADVLIIDCISMLVNNILMSLPENSSMEVVMRETRKEIEELIAAQVRFGGQWIIISNEVGMGLVPAFPLGRVYRDALGWANQTLAAAAQRVIFMIAGIPIVIK